MATTVHRDGSASPIDRAAVERLRHEPLPPGTKGLPLGDITGMTVETLRRAGWNVLAGSLPLPLLTLRESALARNIETMARFCREHDVLLAPHGKTTMAPQLFQRQIDAGCWGITAATPTHAAVYRAFGIGRIVYANQMVESCALRWLAEELTRDSSFDFYCFVDTPDGADRMSAVLGEMELEAPVNVLIEAGHARGRTGCRTIGDALEVAKAISRSHVLKLVGVAGFEGTLSPSVTRGAGAAAIDAAPVVPFLERMVETLERLIDRRFLEASDQRILSAGGSAFFDRVVETLSPARERVPGLHVVLRSGAYVTHDGGYYEETSPLGSRAPAGSPRLKDALELWAVVLSRPEPSLVILSAGKRDFPIDFSPPIPTRSWSTTAGFGTFTEGAVSVAGVSDQHLHLRVPAQLRLEVGDLCACAISHPCTAFDKWKLIPVVNDELTIIDAIRTFF